MVNINSRLGSIADNGSGRFYAYRASKVSSRSVGAELGGGEEGAAGAPTLAAAAAL